MRLAWGALAVACLLAGLWVMLRALGLVEVVLHGATHWWPALLLVAGVAVLLRSVKLLLSVKPGPNLAVAVGLMGTGCLAFAITRGLVTNRIWTFVLAGALISAGLILIRLAARTRIHDTEARTQRVSVLFQTTELALKSAKLDQVRVLLFCGYLELDLRKLVPPGTHRDEPLMIEITAWAGTVKLLIPPGVAKIDHKAFVLRFRNPVQPSVLDKEYVSTAQVVAVTLGLFSDVQFREMPIADPTAPGSEPEPGHLRPATR